MQKCFPEGREREREREEDYVSSPNRATVDSVSLEGYCNNIRYEEVS